jgi:choline dehydrogenase-like flavoprotein
MVTNIMTNASELPSFSEDYDDQYDYIIVGSGAGGGPLAARLAFAAAQPDSAIHGKRVLVIEAGVNTADPNRVVDPNDPKDKPRGESHEVSQVPVFHAVSTEHPDLSWEFFVNHYDQPPTGKDPKWYTAKPGQDPNKTGIFYPRAAALGGCTIHNAMISVAGHDSDWDELADFLKDESWRGARMREYFKKLEYNEYSQPPTPIPTSWWGRAWDDFRWLFGKDPDHTRGGHGFDGWLHTSFIDISLGLNDKQLITMIKAALTQANLSGLDRADTLAHRFLTGRVGQLLDPNHRHTKAEHPEGLALIPVAVCGRRTTIHQNREMPDVQLGHRSSPREFMLEAKAKCPENIEFLTECLVTKVLFDDSTPPRAIGLEVLKGRHLYKAHPEPSTKPGIKGTIRVKQGGEIILAGGSFNTPQLLMLSGIGDPGQLATHGISCRVPSPGVGRNLQDRYEVTVISEMNHEFSLLRGATLKLPDPPENADVPLCEWRKDGTGLYTSNGAVVAIFKRSRPDLPKPDLFIFGVPLPFKGYEVGYSNVGDQHNKFTWTILKAQTRNHDGVVQLRNADPLETPLINFHYFNELSRNDKGAGDSDLDALLDGVKFVRGIASHAELVVKGEAHPYLDEGVADNDKQVRDWIQRVAWGHHACGTCRMGPDGDEYAVLDSRFRVRGVEGLRVVDASIFPHIPGYFIVNNLYMASEKAADVILADAALKAAPNTPADSPKYPLGLREKEIAAIDERRKHVRNDNLAAMTSADWPDDVTGLGISGGGIRSATLGLGILQSLAKHHWLPRIDFLSTVSGGGYIGSFLGRFFDRFRTDSIAGTKGMSTRSAPEQVAEELTNPDSPTIDWLRKHGNYLAPQGKTDWRLDIATYLRNFLSVHFVVGMLIFALYGIANLLRYGLFEPTSAGMVLLNKGDLPLGHLLQILIGPFFSPWFTVFELMLLFLVVPRIVGYWIVSPDRNERFLWVSLLLMYLVGTVLLVVGMRTGGQIAPLAIGVAVFSSFLPVERAWRRGRNLESANGSGGTSLQRARTRNFLTYDLGLMFALTGIALGFAVIDTFGHGLQQYAASNSAYIKAFASLGAALAALIPVVKMASNVLTASGQSNQPPSTLARIFKQQAVAGVLAAVLLVVPLVFFSFTSHAAFGGGTTICVGAMVTLFAAAIAFILRYPAALTFVNRSSLAQLYSDRLARAFLGASNPLRHRPDGANITEVIACDDVESIRDYRPHETGGPLHLINVVVNQTVDFSSQRGNLDRQGENMAVSSIGASIGERWHSLWADAPAKPCQIGNVHRGSRLEPVGREPGDDHPLIDEAGQPARRTEMLSLRQWVGISGAAVGPGRGQNTALGTALLFGLANVRTGYWWDSGITDTGRDGFPRLTFLRRFLYLLPRFFETQALLLFEWMARFPGPWERFWNLADGGFFENTGGYELVRRRVPRIILCDGSADPTYQLESFADFVQKVRIDFDASVEPFTLVELDQYVTGDARAHVGMPDELVPGQNGHSAKHATLYWVKYKSGPARKSVVLYLKASVTGDEATDILHYQATHPEFPHEDTGDQIFNEPQWESYRKLGQHLSCPIFRDKSWFWKIPLTV